MSGERLRFRALADPACIWLALLVAGSCVLRFTLAQGYPAPWILDDEILYSEIAKGLVPGGGVSARDVAVPHWQVGYPLLIAPAYAFFEGRLDAYAAAKLVNSIVMSLAAIPVYLLAMRLVRRPLAVFAGAFTLAVPSMIYTAGLMTENAFYPVFLWCAWSFTRVLERPTLARQLAALAFTAAANLIRPQALVLLPALPTAVFLHAVLTSGGSGRARIRDILGAARTYLPVLAILGTGLFGVVLVWLAGGDIAMLMGPNAGFFGPDSSMGSMWEPLPHRILLHLAELDLSLGILPFAAFLGLLSPSFRAGSRDAGPSVFVAVSLALSLWTALSVGAFTSYVGQERIEERNLFFVAPFFFIALLRWGDARPPRSWWFAACCVISGALPWSIPYQSYSLEDIVASTFALVAAMSTVEALGIREFLGPAVACLSMLGAASLLVLPRRLALLAPALVLGYLVLSNVIVHRTTVAYSEGILAAGVPPEQVDWVDQAVGADARVSVIWHGGLDKLALWQSEFFNRSVSEVYRLYAPPLDRLRADALRADPATGELLDEEGSPVRFDYVLAYTSLVLDAEVIARDPPRSMALYEARGFVRVRTMATGIYHDGWSEPEFGFAAVGCLPGLLTLDLFCNPRLFHAPQTVDVDVGGSGNEVHTLQPGERSRLVIPFPRTRLGPCRAVFTVSPTVIPAQELGLPDSRRLGIYCEGLAYEEASSSAQVVPSGFDRDGWWGTRCRLYVLGNTGGTLTLELQASDAATSTPRTVAARVGEEEVGLLQLAPGEVRSMTLRLPHSPSGVLPLDFEVAPAGLRCASFLYVDGPEAVRTATEGIFQGGRTDAIFRFTAFTTSAGSLTLWVELDEGEGRRTVVAFAEERELQRVDVLPGVETRLSLPGLPSEGGVCTVEFRVIATDTGEPVADHATGILCRGLAYCPSSD